MTQTNKKGFTIVEMLMVIGVLAILMGIVTTAASAAIKQARSRRMVAVQGVIQAGIATYRSQYDAWPPENGQLDKWASNGLSGKSNNGVDSGRHIAFLSADQYDEMMYELAKVSVGQSGASPVLDVTGISVARRSAANAKTGRGMEFNEAIKKNKKHGATYDLKEMAFGYITPDKGYFRRFVVQYNADSDSITVMTQDEYKSWFQSTHPNKSLQSPTGYTIQ